MRTMTPEQYAEILAEMLPSMTHPDAVICRFMENGRTVASLKTGEFHSKGVNIANLTHYWRFSEATAKKIADYTGLTAVISKPDQNPIHYKGKAFSGQDINQ